MPKLKKIIYIGQIKKKNKNIKICNVRICMWKPDYVCHKHEPPIFIHPELKTSMYVTTKQWIPGNGEVFECNNNNIIIKEQTQVKPQHDNVFKILKLILIVCRDFAHIQHSSERTVCGYIPRKNEMTSNIRRALKM